MKSSKVLLYQKFLILISISLLAAPFHAGAETRVAITIDDLPVHGDILGTESRLDITNSFIRVLKRHHVLQAYGFVNAAKVTSAPETKSSLSAWIAAGYPLGNHSYTHMDLNKNTDDAFLKDVDLGEPLLKELSGGFNYKWFRYPFLHEGNTLGKRNNIRTALFNRDYRVAQVTIDFEDYAWNNPYVRCRNKGDVARVQVKWLEESYLEHAVRRLQLAKAQAQILFGRDISHVLLLHIGSFDSRMLDKLLSKYENLGVRFISLEEAESDAAYQIDPGPTSDFGNELLTQIMIARKITAPNVAPLPLRRLSRTCI